MRTFDDTLEYISTIEKARTAQEVCTRLLRFTTDFGLDRMIAGAIPDQRLTQKEQLDHVFFSGWPQDWGQRYFERNYVYHDPIIAGIKRRMEPFVWSEVRPDTEDQLSARIMDEACGYQHQIGNQNIVATLLTFNDETLRTIRKQRNHFDPVLAPTGPACTDLLRAS
jgi:hypothetical protein